jgi:hypothetical protein
MSFKKFTQAPLTAGLELVQRLQRFFMINIKLREHRRNSTRVTARLEKGSAEVRTLEVADVRGRQNLLRIVTNKIQVDGIDTNIWEGDQILIMISDQGKNIGLPAYFAKALHAAG